METGCGERPDVAAVLAHPEALGGGDQHDVGARGMREDLVHVGLDVDRGHPGPAAVARARDTADVDVDMKRSVDATAIDRTSAGITPGRVPGVPALDGLERFDARERV